ncbi:MAG: hypothetical protein IBX64_13340 [Actinobacteria bacterium]|nr:hypothetical protein [Actinomycetota bacterium]
MLNKKLLAIVSSFLVLAFAGASIAAQYDAVSEGDVEYQEEETVIVVDEETTVSEDELVSTEETPAVEPPDEENVALPDDEEDVASEDGTPTASHPENHGKYVSEAAKSETPSGYRNHGEYVREIAKSDVGKKSKSDLVDPGEADGSDQDEAVSEEE